MAINLNFNPNRGGQSPVQRVNQSLSRVSSGISRATSPIFNRGSLINQMPSAASRAMTVINPALAAGFLTSRAVTRPIAERQMQNARQPSPQVPSSVGDRTMQWGVPAGPAQTTTEAPRTTGGGVVARTTTQAPQSPTQQPATDPMAGAISELQRAVEGLNEPMDRTRRESFVKNLALQLGIPDLLGTDYAQGFISGQVGNRTQAGAETQSSLNDGGVGTSLPVEQDLMGADREIQSRLNDIRNSIPEYEMPGDEFKELLEGRMQMNEANYNELIRQIEEKYNVERQNLSNMNRQMVGGTSMFIGRAGAFSSQSGQGAINNEIINAQERMAKLAAEEMMALNMAKQARDEGDLQALQEYLNRSDAARQERNSLARQSFTDEMSAREFAMSESQMLASQARETLNLLTNLPPEELQSMDPNYLSELESNLGVPSGFMTSFSNQLKLLNESQSEQQAFDRTMEVLKFAKDVPAGFEFDIGGQVFTGLQGGGGKTFSVSDGRGGVSFVTVDENTGQLMNTMTLPIGEIKMLSSSGGSLGGSRSGGGGGGDDIAGLSALMFARESVARGATVAEFLQGVMTPEEYARYSPSFGSSASDPITQSYAIDYLNELGIIDGNNSKNFKLINDLTSVDMFTYHKFNEATGTIQVISMPKNTAPTQQNTTVVEYKVEDTQPKERNYFGRVWDAIIGK
jgi:hypothetical protein